MAVTVVNVQTQAFTTGSTLTITKPTGLQAGDILLCHYLVNDGTDTMDTTGGWIHPIANQSAGGVCKVGIQWKIADSTDAAASDFSFGMTGTSVFGGALYAIRGHDSPGSLNTNHAQQVNTTSASTSGVTTSAANALLLLLGGGNTNTNANCSGYNVANNNPGSWNEDFDFGAGSPGPQGICGASATYTASGATGNGGCTMGSDGTIDPRLIIVGIESGDKDVSTSDAQTVTENLSMNPAHNVTLASDIWGVRLF